MTSDELNAIKARNAARTQGQWRAHDLSGNLPYVCTDTCTITDRVFNGFGNAAFIAACSEDVPALIAEVEQLTALLKLAYHAIYVSSSGLSRANLKNDIEAVLEDHDER